MGGGRHDLNSLKIDANGNFVTSNELDPLAIIAGGFSKWADRKDIDLQSAILGVMDSIPVVVALYQVLKSVIPAFSAIEKTLQFCGNVIGAIVNIWKAITTKQVSGDFETDAEFLRRMAEEYESISSELYDIESEVQNITDSIQSKTGDIWVLKNNVNGIKDTIGSDAKKYGNLANIHIECSAEYHLADGTSEGFYGEVVAVEA